MARPVPEPRGRGDQREAQGRAEPGRQVGCDAEGRAAAQGSDPLAQHVRARQPTRGRGLGHLRHPGHEGGGVGRRREGDAGARQDRAEHGEPRRLRKRDQAGARCEPGEAQAQVAPEVPAETRHHEELHQDHRDRDQGEGHPGEPRGCFGAEAEAALQEQAEHDLDLSEADREREADRQERPRRAQEVPSRPAPGRPGSAGEVRRGEQEERARREGEERRDCAEEAGRRDQRAEDAADREAGAEPPEGGGTQCLRHAAHQRGLGVRHHPGRSRAVGDPRAREEGQRRGRGEPGQNQRETEQAVTQHHQRREGSEEAAEAPRTAVMPPGRRAKQEHQRPEQGYAPDRGRVEPGARGGHRYQREDGRLTEAHGRRSQREPRRRAPGRADGVWSHGSLVDERFSIASIPDLAR